MTDEEMAGGLTDEQMVEPGGPESFLHPETFKPSPLHRKLKNTGPIEDVRRELQGYNPQGVHPWTDPINSALDRASFGGLTGVMRLSNKINEATGRNPVYNETLEGIEGYRTGHPTLSQFTDAPAYLTKPTQAVVEGVDRLAGQAVSRFAPQGLNRLAQLGRATMVGGGSNALLGAAEAATGGADLQETGMHALRSGAAGAGVTTALGLPLMAASRAARAVIESRGGQARRFLERQGVEVGPTTPGRGGPMETMATQGTSDADIGIQEDVSARKGLEMLRQEHKGNRAGIGVTANQIAETPAGAEQHDVTDIVQDMRDAASRIGVNDATAAKLTSELARIEEAQGASFNPDTDSYFLSQTQINDLKKKFAGSGGTGVSADARTLPLRNFAHRLQEIASQGPFADVNKRFEVEYARHGRARGQLGLSKNAPKKVADSETEIGAVKNRIGRAGQNTITAGKERPQLEAFRAENPEIGDELTRPEILRRRADISFHALPQKHGGLIERGSDAIQGAAVLEALSHAIGHGHFDLKTAAAAALLGLGTRNLNAINARLLYNPSQNAQLAAQAMLEGVPRLTAPSREMLQEPR